MEIQIINAIFPVSNCTGHGQKTVGDRNRKSKWRKNRNGRWPLLLVTLTTWLTAPELADNRISNCHIGARRCRDAPFTILAFSNNNEVISLNGTRSPVTGLRLGRQPCERTREWLLSLDILSRITMPSLGKQSAVVFSFLFALLLIQTRIPKKRKWRYGLKKGKKARPLNCLCDFIYLFMFALISFALILIN